MRMMGHGGPLIGGARKMCGTLGQLRCRNLRAILSDPRYLILSDSLSRENIGSTLELNMLHKVKILLLYITCVSMYFIFFSIRLYVATVHFLIVWNCLSASISQ